MGIESNTQALEKLIEIANALPSAEDVTSVRHGGTGTTQLPAGEVLVGNGADPVTTKPIDNAPIEDSENLITSGAVYEAIESIPTPDVSGQIDDHNSDSGAHQDIRQAINSVASGKQDVLTGTEGQIATFGSNGKLVAGDMPPSSTVIVREW